MNQEYQRHTHIPVREEFIGDVLELEEVMKSYMFHFAKYGYTEQLWATFNESGWNTSFLDQKAEQGVLTLTDIQQFLKKQVLDWLVAYGVSVQRFREIPDVITLIRAVKQVAEGENFIHLFITYSGLEKPLVESDVQLQARIDELSRQTRNYGLRETQDGLYGDLLIPWGADEATIKSAYRRLCRVYHPDVRNALQMQLDSIEDPKLYRRGVELLALMNKIMVLVNNAHDVLGDAERRQQYLQNS